MQLPHPLDRSLANCRWLARHVAKTRTYLQGDLPFAYRIALGTRIGMDGYFFRHFGLSKNEVRNAVRSHASDEAVAGWFLAQPGVTPARIDEWNRLIPLIGRKGHPAYATRQIVKWFLYQKSLHQPVESIVAAICQDEGLPPSP